MESKNKISYEVENSAKRIDEILNASNDSFVDSYFIPSRDNLTFKNGYYVNVTALFIDIVDSSRMTDAHTRPVLAKTYRAFLSECVAIMNGEENCKEISINGDCVWGVFDTKYLTDFDDVIGLAAKMNSMIKILNYKLHKKNYTEISIGIGIDYGRALMVKAGYSGSNINDIIWMGDVVNSACHLSNKAGRNNYEPILITNLFYEKLNEYHKSLLYKQRIDFDFIDLYGGNIINKDMDNWFKLNCK